MAYTTGLVQWVKYATSGTSGTTSPGVVTGGSVTAGYDIEESKGTYGQTVKNAAGFRCGGSVDLVVYSGAKALLQAAYRSSWPTGSLTPLVFSAGTTSKTYHHLNAAKDGAGCKIDRMTFRMEKGAGRPMTATIAWLGLNENETAVTGSGVAPSGVEFASCEGSVLFGATPYKVQSIEGSISNNLAYQEDLDTKAAASQRIAAALLEYWEDHEITVETAEPITWDPTADAPATDIAITATATSGVTSITFAYTGLRHSGDREMAFTPDGIVTWRYRFTGDPGCLAIT